MGSLRRFTGGERGEIRERLAAGESTISIAKDFDRYPSVIEAIQLSTGGARPAERRPSGRVLNFEEREEISRGLSAGRSHRAIAAGLGRPASTVCREVHRNGGPERYRAHAADRRTLRKARRPKAAKLARCPRLQHLVKAKLELNWSPQQISRWLAFEYPNDPELRVSHETIYMSLYVQGRGALRQELHHALRTGRALRRPKKQLPNGQGQIPNMVLISEHPAEIEDRAVPGHWEGDLIMGTRKTCIGTLVERQTRYVMLLKLNKNTAEEVRVAMTKKILTLPKQLRRSVDPAWDRGSEMSQHGLFAVDTGVQVYFRDPKQPVAARFEREHQRTAPSVLPERHRSLTPQRGAPRRGCAGTQQTPSTDAQLEDTITSTQRGRCSLRRPAESAGYRSQVSRDIVSIFDEEIRDVDGMARHHGHDARKARLPSDYGLSRRWVQKFLQRYPREGEAAFDPRSRRPPFESEQRGSGAWPGGIAPPGHSPEPTKGRSHSRTEIVELRKFLAGKGLDAGAPRSPITSVNTTVRLP